ncbi:hypothetical protein S83_040231 [Arachis hypogaea]
MEGTTTKKAQLPYLGQDILLKIFTKSDPKTVGKCRCLNKTWNGRLSTPMFAKQNWFENKDKNRNVIIGVGLPSMEENSIWFTRTNVDCPQQIPLNIPVVINQFGWYSIIGSCHGVLCIRFSQKGLDSNLLIWNPLIQQFHTVSDEARQHCCHVVSLYAFGFLNHSMEY